MTLRIGVLGVGRIGKMHAELVARQVPGASLAMVQDINGSCGSRHRPATSTCRTPPMPTRCSPSTDVDAVAICSSTDTHVPLMIAAANAGKAIFCEKPISLDLAKVDEALGRGCRPAAFRSRSASTAASTPRTLPCAPRWSTARSATCTCCKITSRDPAPPPIAYIEVSGGLFLDMMIHDFDMARFVTGSEVVEVYAKAAVRVDPAIGEAGDVDTAVVMLRHENGCITTIDNSRQAVYGYDQRVEAFGSNGLAASENPLTHTGLRRIGGRHDQPDDPVLLPRPLHPELPRGVEGVRRLRRHGGGPSPVTAR